MNQIRDQKENLQTDLFTSPDLLSELTDQQREAVEFGQGPLLIVAGAGTGKTMVLTRRIAYLILNKLADPDQILALTFTDKAAAEMEERVDMLLPYGLSNVHISTFHSFGDSILKQYGLEIGINPDYQVLSKPEQAIFFREHLFEFPLNLLRPLGNPTASIVHILNVISRAKDEDVSPDRYIEFAENLLKKAESADENRDQLTDRARKQLEIAGTYKKYQELLIKEGKVDFGDQVFLALSLLRENPSALNHLKERFKYILVDEFQDTNFTQYQLVKIIGGENPNITVVGDDDQSIYKFRGAAISNILGFKNDYPSAHQVVLNKNFRSTQQILDSAYKLIKNNNPDRLEVKNQINKQLDSAIGPGKEIEHIHCDTGTTEADQVASIIFDLVDSGQYNFKDIAILVRKNNQADSFTRSLNIKKIPWLFSGNRGLYGRNEVRILISFLNVICDPDNTQHLYNLATSEIYEISSMGEVLKLTSRAHKEDRSLYSVFKDMLSDEEQSGFSSETIVTVRKIVDDIAYYQELSRDNITGFVLYQFITKSGYLKKLTSLESVENSRKIQNIARFFEVIWAFAQIAKHDRVVFFIEHLNQLIEAGDDPPVAEADMDEDAVNILTVHKAKGLEWPVVFMIGLNHGVFPSINRGNPLELPEELIQEYIPEGDVHLQEERRLFYVAMTRAKEMLYFTSAEDYGGKRKKKISQFVLEALDIPEVDTSAIKTSALEKIERFGSDSIESSGRTEPIPDDSILNLSYYQIDDYNTCPLKYKYAHILRLPFFHHTIVYGKAIHSAIEFYYRNKKMNVPVRVEDLFSAYEKAWRNIGFLSREHEERRFEAGKRTIQRFFKEQEQKAEKISDILVEEPFTFTLSRNRISGRWDFIEQSDGYTVIADFKTSEVFQQEKADKKAKASVQLIIYAMAYNARYGRMPDRLELRFVESGLTGTASVTDKMIEKVKEQILHASEGIRKRDYTADPGYRKCEFCGYRSICPSFNSRK